MTCNLGICAQRCGRINLERMAIVEIILLNTFPLIPKAQNYGDKRRNIIAIPKNGYQVASSSQLFAWFMKAKIYKVESCTIYFALNFPLCCLDYP